MEHLELLFHSWFVFLAYLEAIVFVRNVVMFSTILTTIFFKFIDHQIIADCLIVHPVFYDILSDLSTLLLIFG